MKSRFCSNLVWNRKTRKTECVASKRTTEMSGFWAKSGQGRSEEGPQLRATAPAAYPSPSAETATPLDLISAEGLARDPNMNRCWPVAQAGWGPLLSLFSSLVSPPRPQVDHGPLKGLKEVAASLKRKKSF